MGQVLQQDSIAKLTKASGTQVLLFTSVITVGGQQYKNLSPITLDSSSVGVNGLDAGSLSANQIWYVHAIVNAGALALVASQSKTAPVGYSSFKWTGWVFVSDESSLIAIVANSTNWDWIKFTSTLTALGGGSVSLGTVVTREGRYRRNGDSMEIEFQHYTSSTTTQSGSAFGFLIPASKAIDVNKITIPVYADLGQFTPVVGNGLYSDSAPNRLILEFMPYDANNLYAAYVYNAGNALYTGFGLAGTAVSFKATVPIAGWSANEL